MILRKANTELRCLVVDDDESVRDFLLAILAREGIRAQGCADAREAAHRLRTGRWDLLFVDLQGGIAGGEVLLPLIHRGDVPRPRFIALMGATRPLAAVDGQPWTRNVTFLPKPFLAADARAILERVLGPRDSLPARDVVIAGAGLWCDALARVASRRGGRAHVARDANELAAILRDVRPSVTVAGPSFDDAALVRAVVKVRDEAPKAPVLVGVARGSRARSDLVAIGATAVFALPSELPALGTRMLEMAGLRRVHRRVPLLAPVLCRTGRVLHAAIAFDLAEGGIGLEAVSREHGCGIAEVEFTLPSGATIVAAGEVAWVDHTDTRPRAGLRFTDVDDDSLERIRDHVRTWQREVTGEWAMPEPY